MKKVLHIKSSILGVNSTSSKYADKFIEKMGNVEKIVRDVVTHPVTPLDSNNLQEMSLKSGAVYLEHMALINEIKGVDEIVISTPMHNFNTSVQLHAYFDAIAKAGETFHYEKDGTQVGHLKDKKATVVIARGGIYTGNGITFQEDYIKMLLGFLGISDIKFIFIEGIAFGLNPEQKDEQFYKQVN